MCQDCGWKAALERILEVQGLVNEVLDTRDGDAAQEFADGVGETLQSIMDWVQGNKHVTEAQLQAVENMAAAAGRWLR